MSEPGFQVLRVGSRKLLPTTTRCTNHHRDRGLTTKHVIDLRSVVQDFINCQGNEVKSHDLDHRTQAKHSCTDRHTHKTILGNGSIHQMLGKSRNRVLSTSSFHFLFIAVAIRVNHRMPFETIAYSLKENRLMLPTSNVHRPPHCIAYSQHIIAIYALAKHIKGMPFAVEFRHCRTFFCRHAHTILVIHNEKDYRKLVNFR